jgi:ESCRT-I complex subunit VPS37
MQSSLFAEFPELASASREDIEDLLADPTYFQAIFHSLPQVKALYQSQAELGSANEAIACKDTYTPTQLDFFLLLFILANAIALQETLYALRSETKDAFDEAKALEARWKELDKEQRDVYQVRIFLFPTLLLLLPSTINSDSTPNSS